MRTERGAATFISNNPQLTDATDDLAGSQVEATAQSVGLQEHEVVLPTYRRL